MKPYPKQAIQNSRKNQCSALEKYISVILASKVVKYMKVWAVTSLFPNLACRPELNAKS